MNLCIVINLLFFIIFFIFNLYPFKDYWVLLSNSCGGPALDTSQKKRIIYYIMFKIKKKRRNYSIQPKIRDKNKIIVIRYDNKV